MLVWGFDPVTREYTYEIACQPDPQAEGELILPDHYLPVAPPSTGDNEVAVAGEVDWTVEADYRGQVFYDAAGTEHTITERGDVPDASWTLTKPLTLAERRALMIVKRGQGRYILHEDGLLFILEAFVASEECPMKAKIAYQDATDWARLSESTAVFMQVLGLTDEQADSLFERAALVTY